MNDEVELRKRVYDHLCKTASAQDVHDLSVYWVTIRAFCRRDPQSA